jgi:hypothetical protein
MRGWLRTDVHEDRRWAVWAGITWTALNIGIVLLILTVAARS